MKMPFAMMLTLALTVPLSVVPAGATSGAGTGRTTQSLTFDTALTPQYYGAGEYDGVLHLSIAPDGTVGGWYRDADAGSFRTVIGGLTGTKLWLDLGSASLFDIQGTYENGKIVATTYFGNQLYAFTATPTKT